MTQIYDTSGRALNHIEMVYRPGERKLAAKIFEILGFDVVDDGGTYLVMNVEAAHRSGYNNVVYASEITDEQWRFEQLLQKQLAAAPDLAKAYAGFNEMIKAEPYLAGHFGIRMPSLDRFHEIVARINSKKDADVAGRVWISLISTPGQVTPDLTQAWVKTDVFAAGLVTLGQHVELQYQPPRA